jgi:hypothetical protein
MAEKVSGKWQERFDTESVGEGLSLILTRKGIEVHGFYDSMVGIEPLALSWRDFDDARSRVEDGRKRVQGSRW